MGFFRVNINGTTPAAGEVWSVGMSFIGPNTDIPFEDLRQWAQNIGTFITALTTNTLLTLMSDGGRIVEVRTEQRDDATDDLETAAEYTLPSAKQGNGTPNKTLQTAFCVSLITGRPGRSYRGRVYWPAWGYTPTAELKFSSSNIVTWLSGFNDLVNGVTAAAVAVDPAYNMVYAVRSRLLHTSEPVTTLAGGNIPDTQRRRRDALAETYTLDAI